MAQTLRHTGYEALLMVAGAMAISMRPGIAHGEYVLRTIESLRRHGRARARLEAQGLAVRDLKAGILRLSELGIRELHGGINPEAEWNRKWDERFRVIAFDLPRAESKPRYALRRWLRRNRFGHLQGSVWISPDPLPSVRQVAEDAGLDPFHFFIFTALPAPDESPRELAERAWDHLALARNWKDYLAFARQTEASLRRMAREKATLDQVRPLVADERQRWTRCLRSDPLLPAALHPPKYLGPRAWQSHQRCLDAASHALVQAIGS